MDFQDFITTKNGKIWYGIFGEKQPGVPLLVLHGGPGAPHDYLESLKVMANERPVVFYDQLGCGNSDRPDDDSLWSIEYFVEELSIVCQLLKLENIHILGQSWGSMLAVEYILRKNPAGVRSLILSAPFLNAPRFIADQKTWLKEMPDSERRVIEACEATENYENDAYQNAMMAYYKRHLCRLDPWPECLNRTLERLGHVVYKHMWGASEFTVSGILREHDLMPYLPKIQIPVLLTCGEFDESAPDTMMEYQKRIVNSEFAVFKGASHMHHLEAAEEFEKVLRSFLLRVDSMSKNSLH